VGRALQTLTVTNSSNTGDVTSSGGNWIGGLIGYSDGETTITNSTNTGNINGANDWVGGLIGEIDEPTTITSSTNTGNINGGVCRGLR